MATLWISAEETIAPTGPYTQSAVEFSSLILYKLSGEKYPGVKSVTEVYTAGNSTGGTTSAQLIHGNMYNLPRSSTGNRNLKLRSTPVRSVTSVKFMGKYLDPSEYSLRNGSYLVRTNGTPWILDPVNELEVTYTFGVAPPLSGKRAAIRLANEFILADMGSPNCSLPERVSSVARQGVSYTIMDPQEFLNNGKVGIYEVDLFLAAVNPSKAKKRAKIFVPSGTRIERVN